jgi:hypothetical protein
MVAEPIASHPAARIGSPTYSSNTHRTLLRTWPTDSVACHVDWESAKHLRGTMLLDIFCTSPNGIISVFHGMLSSSRSASS